MSAPGLDHDERSIMSQKCKVSADSYDSSEGTLYLTDFDRLVFVTSSGTFRKSYSKDHYYGLASVNTVRVDSGLLGLIGMGKTLVVEWRNKEADNVWNRTHDWKIY